MIVTGPSIEYDSERCTTSRDSMEPLLPLDRITVQKSWLIEHWQSLELFLGESTSYGQKRATIELAELILSRAAQRSSWPVSSPLLEIDKALKSSREMLSLQEGWDGEGASAIAESTWKRATEFLRNNASTLWTIYGRRLQTPTLVPGADGSIDIHWKLPTRELLINIPPDPNALATYYGDDKRGWNIVEGKLETRAPDRALFFWLTE